MKFDLSFMLNKGPISPIQDLKLSRPLKLIKSSPAISRVSWLKTTDVSGTISLPIFRV
jgi:hypothetical protein